MGDGFTADPAAMEAYAGEIGGMASDVSLSGAAAGAVMSENSVHVKGKVAGIPYGPTDTTGNFDGAYGIICQPFGEIMQDMQDKAAKSIQYSLELLNQLQRNLKESAKQYRASEHRQAVVFKHLTQTPALGGSPSPGQGGPTG
jgi:hypothetical protein